MKPYYEHNGIIIYCGDCLEVMPELELDSIDSIITDPPYGLKFMGQNWDCGIPGISFWRAALRIAKPGAMLLSFGGTRTYHRLTCAIEDAGWEIRDCVMWLYGSGFPKSHNISKAIDKAAGVEREVIGRYCRPDGSPPRDNCVKPKFNGKYNNGKPGYDANDGHITAPTTDAAREWDGWGTALKPAYEPIVLAMAPMPSTFANNALEYGVAGLWVDGCRIETATKDDYGRSAAGSDGIVKAHNGFGGKAFAIGDRAGERAEYKHPQGRWPANVIHDGSDEVVRGFPMTESGGGNKKSKSGFWGTIKNGVDDIRQINKGSAARFFYCAKASPSERGDGNTHPTVKPFELMRYLCRLTKTPAGGVVFDPFMGSGTTLVGAQNEGRCAVGIEISEEYCKIAVERLRQPSLFSIMKLEPKKDKFE